MKNKASKIAYTVFVLILIAAICIGLIAAYKECRRYEENSESTMLQKSVSRLEDELGIELHAASVPSKGKDGESIYTIFHDDEEIASVTMKKNGTVLGMLATFETKEVRSLKRYIIVSPYLDKAQASNGPLELENEIEYDYNDARALISVSKYPIFPKMTQAATTSVFDFSQLITEPEYELRQIKEDMYFLFRIGNEKESKEVQTAADEFIDLYINYATNNITFETIKHSMRSSYPIYKKISKMNTDWLGSYSSLEIQDKKISNVFMLSNDVALVDAEALMKIYRGNKRIDTPMNISLIYIKEGGVWKAAEIANNYFFDHGELKKVNGNGSV